jgi:hypothetical protein
MSSPEYLLAGQVSGLELLKLQSQVWEPAAGCWSRSVKVAVDRPSTSGAV